MLLRITYYSILGKPLIMYLGIITYLSFLFTASISVMNRRKIKLIPFKWHPRMAQISIVLGLIHGILGGLAYF